MVSSNKFVSVIIPVYNVERYIAEAIDSVLNQSLKNIEIILVDDGSTDKSLSICEEFCLKYFNIKLIKQSNSGVSTARNNGLNVASGDYIFFMDSDDTIDSEFINTSYNIAKEKDFDIVIVGKHYCERLPNVAALPTCAQFLKHDFLIKNSDVRFPLGIQPCEDGLFSHQLLSLTSKVGENPYGIYHYREHENQNHLKINENIDKLLNQIPRWFEILEQFYSKHDSFKSHALHLALFMEHEPFELRYIAMPLDSSQKDYLHKLIKSFVNENVTPYLEKKDYKKISKQFIVFLNSKNYKSFDRYYKRHLKIQKLKAEIRFCVYKIKMFSVNFVPISKYRKQIRKSIKLDNF